MQLRCTLVPAPVVEVGTAGLLLDLDPDGVRYLAICYQQDIHWIWLAASDDVRTYFQNRIRQLCKPEKAEKC
jgi:hypothetical protein